MKTVDLVLSILVIGVVCGAIFWVIAADGGRHNPLNNTDEIVITVESTHILFSANFTLYIDGEAKDSWTMGPGTSKIFKYTITLPKSHGPTAMIISVISTGGGLGNQGDSKTITVGTGNIHNVTLRA